MKACELVLKNLNDEIRFYEESDIIDNSFIDKYTPYKHLSDDNLNREVKYFFITTEEFYGEIEDEWISVILKGENRCLSTT